MASAALSSSVWIVCKKRSTTRPGWDNKVLDEMRENITQQLHDFWDAGIRGPDFVWAATGPALEAFSRHPVVKKANAPGEQMSVSEFLRQVRRMVVDFVVGRVLIPDDAAPTADGQEAETGLDDVTNLLPAPPQRLRHGGSSGRRVHPLRPVLQPLRLRPGQPARPSDPGGQEGYRGRRR